MTRFPTTMKTKAAALFATALLTAVIVPLGMVSADNTTGSPDDVIVIVKPRFGTLGDGDTMMVQAVNNLYLFDFWFYDAQGNPFASKDFDVDINTVDPNRPGNPDFTGASLVFSQRFTPDVAASSGTLRIPANALGIFTSPFEGVALTMNVYVDSEGNSLVDEAGLAPNGHYSILANQFAASARWADANQADEGFTPILLVNGQLGGLLTPGNPLMNPGFEIGGTNVDSPQDPYAFSTNMPPWFLAALADSQNQTPNSYTVFYGAGGASGSAASVHYDALDDGRGLAFGQFLTNAPVTWVGGSSLGVQFDVRANQNTGYLACGTVHFIDFDADGMPFENQATRCLNTPVQGGWDWTHVTYDFGNVAEGKTLTSFFFGLAQNLPDTAIISFDNARITGAMVQTGVSAQTDLNDGFSTFMFPINVDGTSAGDLQLGAVELGDGSLGYVFEVAAMDYTGINPQVVDLAGRTVRFQLLDENYLVQGLENGDLSHADEDVLFSTADLFSFVDHTGAPSERRLAVAVADVPTPVVPWFWVDMGEQGPNYESIFGTADPTSAYHSVVRNNLMGHTIADQFDYAFTPVVLGGVSSVVPTADVTIRCLDAGPGDTCADDPMPTLVVGVETASRVLETLPVTLVAAGNEDLVLGEATVATPGGELEFTLTEEQVGALEALGNMRVKAIVGNSVFTKGAESRELRLDNVIPTIDFTISPVDGLVKGSLVTFTDATADDKPILASGVKWSVKFLSDPTPDNDADTPDATVHSATGAVTSYPIVDDGLFSVVLEVTDQDGELVTMEKAFSASNLAPFGNIIAPAYGKENVSVAVGVMAEDADGFSNKVDWDLDGDGEFEVVNATTSAPQSALFLADGENTISAKIYDNDGESTVLTHDIVIDSIGAVTAASADVAPASGWYTGPVDVLITRADERSGIASTRVIVDSVIQDVEGSANITRTLESEGTHTIVAFSTDKAGNVGETVSLTVKIDTTAPSLSFVRATPLPAEPTLASEETTVSVDAADAASGVTKVVFYVQGLETPIVDEDGSDGWAATFDSTGMSGFVEVNAVVHDAAGHFAESEESLTLLVLNPANLG